MLHAGISMHEHDYSTKEPPTSRPAWIRSAFSTSAVSPASHDTSSLSSTPNAGRRSAETESLDEASAQDPELDTMSDDHHSLANSDATQTTIGTPRRRKRLSARSGSMFALAQPAPLTRQQKLLHIRPKLLFQLQLLSTNKRPTPTIDVLASTVIVPRLANRFPRLCKGLGELGSNDVMVLKSEDYSANIKDETAERVEDESIAHREIIAVICQVPGAPSGTEICFSDGSVWYAAVLRRGVFEFTRDDSTTGRRSTARWVPRSRVRPTSDLPTSHGDHHVPGMSKYSFSMLDPTVRRHPILASLQQTVLEIPDHNTSFSSVEGSKLNGHGESIAGMAATVNEEMKGLIQVTGVWVALQLGWCPNFRYDDARLSFSSSQRQTKGYIGRSASMTQNTDRGWPQADTPTSMSDSGQASELRQGRIIRSSTQILHDSPANVRTSVSEARPRMRAVSTGAAFMQKAAARRVHPSFGSLEAGGDHEGAQLPPSSEKSMHNGLGLRTVPVLGHRSWDTVNGPPQQLAPTAAGIQSPAKVEAYEGGDEGKKKFQIEGRNLGVEPKQARGRQRGEPDKQKRIWWKPLVGCFTHDNRANK